MSMFASVAAVGLERPMHQGDHGRGSQLNLHWVHLCQAIGQCQSDCKHQQSACSACLCCDLDNQTNPSKAVCVSRTPHSGPPNIGITWQLLCHSAHAAHTTEALTDSRPTWCHCLGTQHTTHTHSRQLRSPGLRLTGSSPTNSATDLDGLCRGRVQPVGAGVTPGGVAPGGVTLGGKTPGGGVVAPGVACSKKDVSGQQGFSVAEPRMCGMPQQTLARKHPTTAHAQTNLQ